jgi:hypothetical protein
METAHLPMEHGPGQGADINKAVVMALSLALPPALALPNRCA